MTRFLFVAAIALVACSSNPTPHPGQSDLGAYDTQAGPDSSSTLNDKGPDRDDDGVPDCEQFGGLWDATGDTCVGGSYADLDASDGGDAGDVEDADDGDDVDGDDVDGDATIVGPEDTFNPY